MECGEIVWLALCFLFLMQTLQLSSEAWLRQVFGYHLFGRNDEVIVTVDIQQRVSSDRYSVPFSITTSFVIESKIQKP